MNNLRIAEIFSNIADILELKGESIFRIRAYRQAALNLRNLTEDVSEISKRNELKKISGIGTDLEEKINSFLKTGRIELYDKLLKKTPKILLDLVNIQGIGPKRALLIYKKLKIKSVEELEKLLKSGNVKEVSSLKEKSIQNIIRGIEFSKRSKERMNLGVAYKIANNIVASLKKNKNIEKISIAGSLRRFKDTIGDIDILVVSRDPKNIMDSFTSADYVKAILAKGPTKSSVIIKEGIEADLRVVEKKSFGAALNYFTGSKAHNIKLREMAVKIGLKLNEYGIFKKDKYIAGESEEDVYKILGLQYIPPELREDTGEIEASLKKHLPKLVEIKDIKGDFHIHSNLSDGLMSLEEIAEACSKLGYEYAGSTDHSKTLHIAGGLTDKELIKKIKAIDKINKRFKNFTLLKSAEVDILKDGSPDYSDDLLKELDIVVAAIHSGFKDTKDALTKRIIKAMKNKFVHIIAHPTGRLFGVREGYEVNFEEILKVAKDTNTALEINSFPERLDVNDAVARLAKEKGVLIAISTDSHQKEQLNNMFFGLGVARRGWLEKKDVLNCLPLKSLIKKIKK